MKNFSEALAIKPNLKLTMNLILTPVGAEEFPCEVIINGEKVYSEFISEVQTITREIDLFDPIDIHISLIRVSPQAVKVMLVVDGQEVLPAYKKYADPPTTYIDETPTSHLYYKMKTKEDWSFKIPSFYDWFWEASQQGDIF